MKKAILIALAILLAILMALWPADAKPHSIKGSEQQKTQDTYNVSAFTILSVKGQIEVEFKQNAEEKYTVSYEGPYNLAERLEITSQDGILFIRYGKPMIVLGDQHVRVQVTAPDLKRIVVQDGAEVHAHEPLAFQEINISGSGKSEVELDDVRAQSIQVSAQGDSDVEIGSLNCQTLQVQVSQTASFDAQRTDCDTIASQAGNRGEVSITGLNGRTITVENWDSSQTEIKGKVETASLTARGHSEIDAGALQAATADVMAARSSHIEVRVSDTLNAQAENRAVVAYKGWPQVINKTGKGTVKQDK